MIPEALEQLVGELGKLPGIGRRTAERLAFDLLRRSPARPVALAAALERVGSEIGLCPRCFYYAERGQCVLRCDRERDPETLCVVESPMDVVAFEKANPTRMRYHVLGGKLVPMKGIGPEQLHLAELRARVAEDGVREVIVATSPSVEGDATAIFLAGELARAGVRVTRIGRGIPTGGSLEHSDAETLRQALDGRRELAAP
ncbi:MAG: recombination mediator RecR [Candidatus Sumerlaeia bacterium]|nr:recombination mediator RecR [Candidatus Sumerlaeia bacterium]